MKMRGETGRVHKIVSGRSLQSQTSRNQWEDDASKRAPNSREGGPVMFNLTTKKTSHQKGSGDGLD